MIKSISFKKLLPHLVALILFASISAIYFYPVMQGYRLKQSDIKLNKGMAHEARAYKADFGNDPLWTGSMFAGLPTYQITGVRYAGNVIAYVHEILMLGFAYPIAILILYMIGFYILLLCLKIDPWLSIIGAIAFAFSSYFIVILEAGHNTKALAIAYMPALLGGIISILRGRVWIGALLTAVFMGLELYANHIQVTYYLIFVILIVGLVEMVYQIKAGNSAVFFKRAGIVVLAVALGIMSNVGNLLSTYEYSKYSTRSPSELTIGPDGQPDSHLKSTGLDKDYITKWSNGIQESFSLMLPHVKGGKSGAILGDEKEVQRLRKEDPQFFNFMVSQYQNKQFLVNTYWGNQPFTSGPVYVGIIICFLALLAIFFIKDRLIIGLGIAAILALLLSWGRNFMGLTDFFIDYIPMYNKFRAVSMILILIELILPVFAILFLAKLIQHKEEILKQKKRLFTISGIFVGVLLLFWLTPQTFFDFLSNKEVQTMNAQLQKDAQQSNVIYAGFESIKDYRVDVFKSGVITALQYVILAFLILFLYLKGKINSKLLLLGIGGLILIDLWVVDKNYINNKEKPGTSQRAGDRYLAYELPDKHRKPYAASPVDKAILQNELKLHPEIQTKINNKLVEERKELGKLSTADIEGVEYSELMLSTNYRVLNTTQKMDEDAQTAYFHKTLGGYHAAKMKKYQEVIDFQLGMEHYQLRQAFLQGGQEQVVQMLPQMKMTDMLNAKYIIGAVQAGKGQQLSLVKNPYALGNAWFVDSYKIVTSADEEIMDLRDFDPSTTALVRVKYKSDLADQYQTNPSNSIKLKSYLPNKLVYEYKAATKQLTVFSEIYYDIGWKAYINDEEVPYFSVNYILRGMEVPAGEGEIVFKFNPTSYKIGKITTWASSILILLLLVGVIYRRKKETNQLDSSEEIK